VICPSHNAPPGNSKDAKAAIEIDCGERKFRLELQIRHCDIFNITEGKVNGLRVDFCKASAVVNTNLL
jgi:hypothetical protein